MLIARDDELVRVAALIAASAGGDGGVLVVGGEVGVGRTALVDEVVSRARTGPPVTVLRVSCLDCEAELAFVGLGDLLRPLHDRLSLLPPPQAAALSAALALAPQTDDPVNPFTIAVGTLEVLAGAGADTPVLVVVDDAQWLDAASAAALLFARPPGPRRWWPRWHRRRAGTR